MQFEGARRSSQALNLTPLIDIVFLLLVFFMLTAHFVKNEGIPIELPEAVSAMSMDEDKPLEVKLSKEGVVSIAGTELGSETLYTEISKLLEKKDEKRVVIHGDAGVALGGAVKVIDAARQAGASGVDIVTQQPEQN